jgi:hypothetical protein
MPVVKLFMPEGAVTWLLSELYPACPDRAFGLSWVTFPSPD